MADDLFAGLGGGDAPAPAPQSVASPTPSPAQPAAPLAAPPAAPQAVAPPGGPAAGQQNAPPAGSWVSSPQGPIPATDASQPYTDADGNYIEPGQGDLGEAMATGALKAGFDTKDAAVTGFGLFDNPSVKGGFRTDVEQSADLNNANGGGAGFIEGLTQVGVGLLGAGKVTALLKGGVMVGSAAAALAQAASLAPHAENIANIVEKVPGLSNPVSQWLASKDTDSTAAGYAKNALASLGFDAAAISVFAGTIKVYKALSGGADEAAQAAAHAELDTAMADHVKQLQDAKAAEAATPAVDSAGNPIEAVVQPHAKGPKAPEGDAGQAGLDALSKEFGVEPSDVQRVDSATQGAEAAGVELPPKVALPEVSDDDVLSILQHAQLDTDAITEHGSWDAAISAGHVFGDETKIPWQKMGSTNDGMPETSLDAFTQRVIEQTKAAQDEMKGGDVITDASNAKSVAQFARLFNTDPAAAMGLMAKAGDAAGDLRATMDGSFAVGQRVMQDAWAMSSRINAGYLDEWNGSIDQAHAALKEVIQVAAQAYGNANSLLANAGRAMRGARAEFKASPSQIAALQSMDGESLVSFLQAAQGDPRAIATVLKPPMWQRMIDAGQLLMINDLISGPLTHVVIAGTNVFQMLTRPLERSIGAWAVNLGRATPDAELSAVGAAAARQYSYYASTIPDAFSNAVKAFKVGDSIMNPHAVEASAVPLGQEIAQMTFIPIRGDINGVMDAFKNVGIALAKTGILPGRLVGFQDELVKQMVYRAYVSSRAEVEGSTMGLADQALAQHVKDAVYGAFDDMGRATDQEALDESKVATFQQELQAKGNFGLPTMGAKVQQFTNGFPPGKVVLPFVKTPTNLFRNGVQLTPGLNMLQKEWRDGLTGARGAQAQAQAVGQLATGTLLMGTAALLADQGLLTGSGPSDPKTLHELQATGWRPNSIVARHPDGTVTYVPMNRWDPFAMPLSMAADIVSVLKQPGPANENKAGSMMAAMFTGLLKNLNDKTYLVGMSRTLDAIRDPDRSLSHTAATTVQNFIPFATGIRQANWAVGDQYMREARSFGDDVLSIFPGYSQKMDPKRDWAGDPITVHKGLWLNTDESRVDAEIQRLGLSQDGSIGPPSSKAAGGTGADLKTITMAGNRDPAAAGRNAYDYYQDKAGHPQGQKSLRDVVSQLMASPGYQAAPDGTVGEKGTKIDMVMTPINAMRQGALKAMSGDKNVGDAINAENQRIKSQRGILTPPAPTIANAASSMVAKLHGFMGSIMPSQGGGQ